MSRKPPTLQQVVNKEEFPDPKISRKQTHIKVNGVITTDKQRKFAERYLQNGRDTVDAYIWAYGRGKMKTTSLKAKAYDVLLYPGVKVILDQANAKAAVVIEKVTDRYAIDKERILVELARIAFADPRDVVEWGPNGVVVKESKDLPPDAIAAVSEVVGSRAKDGEHIVNVKKYDKIQALNMLAKHLGMLTEKTEHTHKHAVVNFIIEK